MIPSLQSANVYTDLQGLEAVRRGADENSPETLRFAAQQFEALFIQMMLKSAREAQIDDGLFDSEQSGFYEDLHDKQLAIHLSQGQGIGLADMLVRQLRQEQGAVGDGAPVSAQGQAVERIKSLQDSLSSRLAQPSPGVETAAPIHAAEPALGTPEDFVAQLWPQARQAAETLGVAPAVLLAQAALETGWGRAVSRHPDGRSSHNLFNIKADRRWEGEQVQVSTVEYRDGVAVRERAQFRAYDSYADSFADYVAFLQDSTRYHPALAVASDGSRFVAELARAGYATDPAYAEKIMGIVNGEPLGTALSGLPGGPFRDL